MIRTSTKDNKTTFQDESEHLSAAELTLVRAGMAAGFTEFTTPTLPDNDGRTNWRVKKWVTFRDGKPAGFLVASLDTNAHFEVMGPELDLGAPQPKPDSLQKR